MSSNWGGAWNSLKYSVGNAYESAGMTALSSISYRYLKNKDGVLVYKNNRAYKSVLVHVIKQTSMQLIESEVNKLFPKYQRYLESQLRKTVLKQQESNYKKLIEAGEKVDKDFGSIKTEEGQTIVAKDKYGNAVPEALMLYYKADNKITVTDTVMIGESVSETTYQTSTICFIDLIPRVSIQSSKNLILTQVQGRDYSRKELVSGGDLTFSVSGQIVSNEIDVYPENSVKKFIQIVQHGGVVKVNHLLFKQFNIDQVIIKDYNLSAPECKNIQPYSFTCVAVEPDEDVAVVQDTIAVLNQEITLSPMNKWYKFILNSKYSEIIANTAAGATSSLANAGLSTLAPNI